MADEPAKIPSTAILQGTLVLTGSRCGFALPHSCRMTRHVVLLSRPPLSASCLPRSRLFRCSSLVRDPMQNSDSTSRTDEVTEVLVTPSGLLAMVERRYRTNSNLARNASLPVVQGGGRSS